MDTYRCAHNGQHPYLLSIRPDGHEMTLTLLTEFGFIFSEPIQEDYGWGFWVSHGKDRFWVAISYVGDGPQEPPAQWVVSVNYDPGLNPVKRFFHKPDGRALAELRDRIWQTLAANSTIKTIDTSKQSERRVARG